MGCVEVFGDGIPVDECDPEYEGEGEEYVAYGCGDFGGLLDLLLEDEGECDEGDVEGGDDGGSDEECADGAFEFYAGGCSDEDEERGEVVCE